MRTDTAAFWAEALSTLHFTATEPGQLEEEFGNPLKLLDLLEFVYRHVAQPIQHGFHDYYTHWHLDFNEARGKAAYVSDINDLFRRFGLAFEMRSDGTIVRTPPEEVADTLLTARFHSGDPTLDNLLEDAREKFTDPDPTVRMEALQTLWDALERLKTIAAGKDKTAQVTALIDSAYAEPHVRRLIDAEFTALSAIGNAYNIRHFETSKHPIPDDAFADYLFARCYSLIHLVLKKTGRVL